MNIKPITAVFPRDKLEAVEKKRQVIGVERIDVSTVKGYGEYRNYYAWDWMVDDVKLDIFTRTDEVDSITTAIVDGAHTGEPGDGIVAVVPADKFFQSVPDRRPTRSILAKSRPVTLQTLGQRRGGRRFDRPPHSRDCWALTAQSGSMEQGLNMQIELNIGKDGSMIATCDEVSVIASARKGGWMSAATLVLLWVMASTWPGSTVAQTSSPSSVVRGAEVFRACAGCHSFEPGRNLSGPSLAVVIGRKAGSVPTFLRYSTALKSSGIIWTSQTLDAWIANPAAFIAGSAMPFRGLPDPKARADLVAFIAGVSTGSADAIAQMGRLPQLPSLKTADAAQRVTAVRHCQDTYFVSTANGHTRPYWEFDLRFKTDTSDRGPVKKQPVLVGQGMGGDRAQIVFGDPTEISAFIKDRCE